jgi:hypothetical protein
VRTLLCIWRGKELLFTAEGNVSSSSHCGNEHVGSSTMGMVRGDWGGGTDVLLGFLYLPSPVPQPKSASFNPTSRPFLSFMYLFLYLLMYGGAGV